MTYLAIGGYLSGTSSYLSTPLAGSPPAATYLSARVGSSSSLPAGGLEERLGQEVHVVSSDKVYNLDSDPLRYTDEDAYVRVASQLTSTYCFDPQPFLKPGRKVTQFVGSASAVESYVREIFESTVGSSMPYDFSLNVVSEKELQKIHADLGGAWSPGIQGFALNRKGQGVSEIFVKENYLDALLLVIGHEIGHVLSEPLPDQRDEEAKAFAFEMAWMQTIMEHDVAGLAASITLDPPAQNGLHDVALSFVRGLISAGREALSVFGDLRAGLVSIGGLERVVLA